MLCLKKGTHKHMSVYTQMALGKGYEHTHTHTCYSSAGVYFYQGGSVSWLVAGRRQLPVRPGWYAGDSFFSGLFYPYLVSFWWLTVWARSVKFIFCLNTVLVYIVPQILSRMPVISLGLLNSVSGKTFSLLLLW